MNNDMVYLVVMTIGTIALGLAMALKPISQKVLCSILAGFMFLQSGICAYNGMYGNVLKMRQFSFFTVAEARESGEKKSRQ